MAAPQARLAASCLVATVAFWAYTSTLLPGVDVGDTGGFQAAVLWPETSARRGYPLYYALAQPFVAALSSGNPARGLNLFSAVSGALAVGLLTWSAALVIRSALAGAAAGLLLAFSYTFWTQAIIAEVYALHLALVAVCLVTLHAFAARPTTVRLAVFLSCYALAFGNHLSMILLMVPFTVFLLQVHPRRRELFRAPVVGLAIAIALGGALQYAANFMSVWSSIEAPARGMDRIAAFWFDTTKADWRELMVFGVPGSEAMNRIAMWAWDARQQFGVAGLLLACAGCVRLWAVSRPWAVLITLAYGISTAFALTYNVGDPHVFFLPGHFFTAFAAAAALAPWGVRAGVGVGVGAGVRAGVGAGVRPHEPRGADRLHVATVCAVLLYAGWRGWDTWPAVDRHQDHRADVLVARIAQGLNDSTAVLASRLDWESENALLYSSRYERRDLAWTRLSDVLLHFPFFVRDNLEIGRDVVLTANATADVIATFGPLFPIVADEALAPLSLPDIVEQIDRGTPYVLTLLAPPRDERFDPSAFDSVLRVLTGGRLAPRSNVAYELWAGVSGESPAVYRASNRPFRHELTLAGDAFTVRMDAWLPFDTFRRGGFGHVLRSRQPILTVERGVSLVWFRPDGTPAQAYAAGLYAPKPRFRIPAGATLRLAALPD